MNIHRLIALIAALLALGWLLSSPGSAMAHCDGLDGPVVTDARTALAKGDVDLALGWVREEDEQEIRHAFDRTREVRKLGGPAQELADTYFFETLVRVHRAGEGAPYTGLKPAGRDLGPAIPLADRALVTGSVDPLVELIASAMRHGLIERFERAAKARSQRASGIEAGRDYVHAYVAFIHYAERAYEVTGESAGGHLHEDPVEGHPK